MVHNNEILNTIKAAVTLHGDVAWEDSHPTPLLNFYSPRSAGQMTNEFRLFPLRNWIQRSDDEARACGMMALWMWAWVTFFVIGTPFGVVDYVDEEGSHHRDCLYVTQVAGNLKVLFINPRNWRGTPYSPTEKHLVTWFEI